MPKLSWNDFTVAHPKGAIALGCSFPNRLPPGLVLDGNGKKLPTPYALLTSVLGDLIKGEWCAMTVKGGALFKIIEPEDLRAVSKSFSLEEIPNKLPPGCSKGYSLTYGDYWKMAGTKGYSKKAAPPASSKNRSRK